MLPERFWAKVRKTAECWIWTGAVTAHGYPKFRTAERVDTAYRVAWTDVHGPIPPGLQLDHVCHSSDPTCTDGVACLHRRCVNPQHLELVDGATNVRRAHKGNATVCKNGHLRTAENTRVRTRGAGAPARDCLTCRAERRRARGAH